jgi:predicted chitinase
LAWPNALERFGKYQIDLNNCLRKYNLHLSQRFAQLLAQVYVETGLMRYVAETTLGRGSDYGSFYGRGILQLTWPKNYADYGAYRNLPTHASGTYQITGNPADPITSTSAHNWSGATDKKQWAPRYDPSLIATDTFSACDSGGYFWITKHYTGTTNINRLIDTGFNTDTVGKTSVLINGGSNGYNERQGYAAYVYRYLSDSVQESTSENLHFTVHGIRNGKWLTHGTTSVHIDFTPQRQ